MPSSSTQNYQLSQWSKDDRVLMEDFNADNTKIDAAVKAEADARAAGDAALQAAVAGKADASTVAELAASHLRLVTGSYVGTGEDGFQTLTFPFSPAIVFIAVDRTATNSAGVFFIRGQRVSSGIGFTPNSNLSISVTWKDNSVTWYTSSSNNMHFNSKDYTYFYFALG